MVVYSFLMKGVYLESVKETFVVLVREKIKSIFVCGF